MDDVPGSVDDELEGAQTGGEHQVPKQPEDNDTPFSPPTDPIEDASEGLDERVQDDREPVSEPELDTGQDSQEIYDAGPDAGHP